MKNSDLHKNNNKLLGIKSMTNTTIQKILKKHFPNEVKTFAEKELEALFTNKLQEVENKTIAIFEEIEKKGSTMEVHCSCLPNALWVALGKRGRSKRG